MIITSPSHYSDDHNRKICAIDLDDTLCFSTEKFLEYCKDFSHFGKGFIEISGEIRREITSSQEMSFYFWPNINNFENLIALKKKVPYYFYRLIKNEYRNSIYKSTIEPREGAQKFLQELAEAGYSIIIMTARDLKYSKKTIDWLERYEMIYHGIIFGKNKHIDILQRYPNLDFMIEDNRSIANNVAKWGYKVYLMSNIYNEGELDDNVERTFSYLEILEDLRCRRKIITRQEGEK